MRVAISGMGCVSAAGRGVDATRRGLYAAPPLPVRCRRVETALEIPVFELDGFASDPEIPGGVTMRLLLAAVEEALCRAGLDSSRLAGKRVGVCVGSTVGCQLNDIPFYAALRESGSAPAKPFLDFVSGSPAEYLRRKYALLGPALTVSNACTSGADAIGIAGLWIACGRCDYAIAAGADELNRVPLDGFHALGVCSDAPCRPFDAARSGLNLGEGAAAVILEPAESAAQRGIGCRLELAGFGKSADAFHITQPDPEGNGLERAIRQALKSAGAGPEEFGFINAHGTGTAVNDPVEAATLARVFGSDVKFMSTKGLTGHTLGAAGALEFVFTCLMLDAGVAAKSANFETPSGDVAIAPLAEHAVFCETLALSTSLAFGGSNTALAARRVV